jgi:hypothetical protein
MRPGIRGQFLPSKEHGAGGVCLVGNTVQPLPSAPFHKHSVEETTLVLEGIVWVRLGGEHHIVGPQQTVIIPAGMPSMPRATPAPVWPSFRGPSVGLIPSLMRFISRAPRQSVRPLNLAQRGMVRHGGTLTLAGV